MEEGGRDRGQAEPPEDRRAPEAAGERWGPERPLPEAEQRSIREVHFGSEPAPAIQPAGIPTPVFTRAAEIIVRRGEERAHEGE